MSRLVLPWLPVGWLLRSRFDNVGEAARVTGAALVMAGEEDEVVPVAMGRRVHAALGSSSKALHIEPGAGHNDLWMGREDRLAALVARFAREGRPSAGN
jgi:pimeloyl-ACP methyl ester carboxylesterase